MRFRFGRWVTQHVMAGPMDELNPLLDDDRSQYPYDTTSGFWAYGASQARTSMILGVSSRWFKPETLNINNDNATPNKFVMYDGNLSRTAFHITVKGSDTEFIGKDFLRGIFFVSGVFISNLDSNLQVRIGGKLIASIQANV